MGAGAAVHGGTRVRRMRRSGAVWQLETARGIVSAGQVVLATNVAETSLTIPGVTAVVDSGLVRRSRFDPVSGMSRLALMRISRAATVCVSSRIRSASVDLPWSMWAMIEKLRM